MAELKTARYAKTGSSAHQLSPPDPYVYTHTRPRSRDAHCLPYGSPPCLCSSYSLQLPDSSLGHTSMSQPSLAVFLWCLNTRDLIGIWTPEPPGGNAYERYFDVERHRIITHHWGSPSS